MIDMSKKYRTRDGRAVRLLCTDIASDTHPVCGVVDCQVMQWDKEGRRRNNFWKSPDDLIEVVPDVVTWRVIRRGGHYCVASTLDEARRFIDGNDIAILRTTIRNGGQSHADVTVEVLPVDYKEPTP